MSEYWKSVPRKFCEFCKCWITDNKPSVEFHERGKRHKENVELKLKEIRKKSLENSLQADEMKSQMDKLEKAALKAFKKDLKDNPELAAKYGVSLEPKPQTAAPNDIKDPASQKLDQASTEIKKNKAKEWHEAVSPEGYHYYWNVNTGESTWEAPEEFVSIQEQETDPEKKDSSGSETVKTSSSDIDTSATSEDQNPVMVTRLDPGSSRSAYGGWDVVKEIEQPVMYSETSIPPALDEIPLPTDTSEGNTTKLQKQKFKEKTVSSISSSSEGAVAFKKRKVTSGARNVRQKDSND